MGKIARPRMEIVRFGTGDVIATSGLPVYSVHSNQLSSSDRYLLLNGEMCKGFSEWNEWYSTYNSDTAWAVGFEDGYYFTNWLADDEDADDRSFVYLWYGSGYGVGNVVFNTQGQSWSYYLDNDIELPTSD